MPALTAWQNFYVIVGSSAGALTGLQFVVVALVADLPDTSGFARSSGAFSTPTIIHFGAVLFLSAIFSAPWSGVGAPLVLVRLVGLAGFIYVMIVLRRTRRIGQEDYTPVFEDWLFHVFLPAAAYATLIGSAFASRLDVRRALFGVAAAALLLLGVGIHNAWDSVVYIVTMRTLRDGAADAQAATGRGSGSNAQSPPRPHAAPGPTPPGPTASHSTTARTSVRDGTTPPIDHDRSRR